MRSEVAGDVVAMGDPSGTSRSTAQSRRGATSRASQSQRLQQHLHDLAQTALGVADELLEDLVRHLHELFHPRESLPRELNFLLLRAALAHALLGEQLLTLADRLQH